MLNMVKYIFGDVNNLKATRMSHSTVLVDSILLLAYVYICNINYFVFSFFPQVNMNIKQIIQLNSIQFTMIMNQYISYKVSAITQSPEPTWQSSANNKDGNALK